MFEKTYMTPFKGEPVRPFFRTPLGFVDNMLSEVENLWQRPLFRMNRRFDKDMTWVPTFDVYEHEGELVVKADLPGLKKEDIRIYLEDGALVLQGERKEEKKVEKESFYVAECGYGSFYRRLPLAFEADFNKVDAKFTDGVLEIHIPIPAVEPPKPQEITLN
ncbi:MAG: Hsp20/alpha crystallin family protein [Thermoanaerobaculia bacterium]